MSEREAGSRLAAGLRAVAEEGRHRAAGPEVEARLVAAYRARHAPRRPRRRTARAWYWSVGAAAAAAVAAWIWSRPAAPELPPLPVPVARIAPAPLAPPAVAAVTVRRTPRARAAAVAARRQAPRMAEEQSPFIPLPWAARLSESEALDVVRVRMPRASLARWGMPVSVDRAWEPVKADVVFGEDGMARAIRFVK